MLVSTDGVTVVGLIENSSSLGLISSLVAILTRLDDYLFQLYKLVRDGVGVKEIFQ